MNTLGWKTFSYRGDYSFTLKLPTSEEKISGLTAEYAIYERKQG
jgi:hypothetical protein